MDEERRLRSLAFWIRRLVAGGVWAGSVLGLGPVIWCCVVRSQYEVGPSLEYGDGVVDDRSGL